MPHSFENYDDKASTYTSLRSPIALDETVQFLTNKSCDTNFPSDYRLLDSGCGTGNYAVQFICNHGLKSVHLCDFNGSMLSEAHKNLKCLETDNTGDKNMTLDFHQADICSLDSSVFREASYDGVINNQVLHHLRPDNDFADLKRACKEWYRVLKPGGRLAINFAPPSQQSRSMWWAELIPNAMEIWSQRSPSVSAVQQALAEAGFIKITFKPIYDEMLYDPAAYYNFDKFKKDIKSYGRQDSTFNLCTEEELKEAAKRVKDMQENGTLENWKQQKELERTTVGQTTCCFAVK